jgi:hypothetical protein
MDELRAEIALGLLVGLLLAGACAARTRHAAFQGTYATREALAEAVLEALWQRNPDRLEALAISEAEFRSHVWPRLPAGRSGGDGALDYWWADTRTRSLGAMAQTLEQYGGRRMALESVSCIGETTDYGEFSIHRSPQLTVRTDTGEVVTLRLFGSLVEAPEGWKLYSYIVD